MAIKLLLLLQQKLYMGLYISIVLILTTIPLLTKADNHRLPIPRFASIKANEVNARVGPTIKAPIEWVFIKKGEPIEIIAEYEQWRQIRDIKGEGGWVHLSVLSGKRSVIVVSPELVSLTRVPNDQNKIVARISNYVRCLLKKCKKDYCQVCCKNYTGWLPKTVLWGVYKDEC
jgi:SH3-like domain-containing protein